mmetsp:Transcript_60291/g.73869  ORF Transcript_60291/g.73869 Transcript_60291/m.73869 type:complete len:136 (+) Transcript_60291:22-429(+)
MAKKLVEHDVRNPTKEGWLEKQSRHLRKWRKRWCVLEGSTLYTFKTQKNYENPTECLSLKIFSSVKSSEDTTHRAYSFDIYSSQDKFSFVAKTGNDKEDWIRHIGKAIVLSNNTTKQRNYNYGDNDDDSDDESNE